MERFCVSSTEIKSTKYKELYFPSSFFIKLFLSKDSFESIVGNSTIPLERYWRVGYNEHGTCQLFIYNIYKLIIILYIRNNQSFSENFIHFYFNTWYILRNEIINYRANNLKIEAFPHHSMKLYFKIKY